MFLDPLVNASFAGTMDRRTLAVQLLRKQPTRWIADVAITRHLATAPKQSLHKQQLSSSKRKASSSHGFPDSLVIKFP